MFLVKNLTHSAINQSFQIFYFRFCIASTIAHVCYYMYIPEQVAPIQIKALP